MTFSFLSNHLPFRVRRKPPFLLPVPKPSSASRQPPKHTVPTHGDSSHEVQRERGQRCKKERKPTHEQHPPGRLSLSHAGPRTHTPHCLLWNGRVAGNPGAAHWFQSLLGFHALARFFVQRPPFPRRPCSAVIPCSSSTSYYVLCRLPQPIMPFFVCVRNTAARK
ncbi:uncharacterized protein LY79DRAFT_550503 [Colletotrichum navitas]|uniref:Uncharacterized protein n=1 Tax=Colletotrichum navitas TaxID=681940 RepID=A0AAD8V635_9PEZI|nr:uncharacterized protein LY79DRAFT_550503 [Colletotrichum navitas]KAK1593988.1 hypothetical protein LY79DRAFT_550503 [Colletotrichum navitas]